MANAFEDWLAINGLLMTHAEHIDAARFTEAASMFANSTYRLHRAGDNPISCQGTSEVEKFFSGTRVYPDGTTRTKHVITNVNIEIDDDRATSHCYATVFQQTEELPLQPIAAGRYIDSFERVGGEWRFTDRLLCDFLLGDRSHHVVWHADSPEAAVS